MLGKLMKYEFKSTMRTFLPMYAALIIFAVLNKAIFSLEMMSSLFKGMPSIVTMVIYVALCAGVMVLSLVVGIQRFHKNLLGNEGYLTHTLPANTWQLIVAKLLPSTIWSTLSLLLVICCSVFMGLTFTELRLLPQNIASTFRLTSGLWGVDLTIVFLEILGCTFLSMAFTFCLAYASLAVGQLFNRHRVLLAFAAFVAACFLIQWIMATVVRIYTNFYPNQDFIPVDATPMTITHYVCALWACFSVIFGAASYALSNFLLRRHLNLL